MAVAINNKVGFKIGSTSTPNLDLSDYVTSFSFDDTYDTVEVTAMGDTSHKVIKGLYAGSLTIDLLADDAATAYQSFLALIGTTAYYKAINDDSAAVSASNILYSGQIFINGLQPINGAVGDVKTMSVTFTCQNEPTRATSGTW